MIGSSMLSREQRDVCNTGMITHLTFVCKDDFYGYFNLLNFQDMAPHIILSSERSVLDETSTQSKKSTLPVKMAESALLIAFEHESKPDQA